MIIYSITNKIDGKRFIGQTASSLEKRWKEHILTLRLEYKLYQSMSMAGLDSFNVEVLETVDNQDLLNKREKHWIAHYNTINTGYNTMAAGSSKSEEHKANISKAHLGKPKSDEHKANMAKAARNRKVHGAKGRTLSNDHKIKLHKANKGKTPWNKGLKYKIKQTQMLSEPQKSVQ